MSDPSKMLDEIERLASADLPDCPWHTGKRTPQCVYELHGNAIVETWGGDRSEALAAFIAAANPETVLALIEVARLANEGAIGGFTPDVARDIRAALERLGGTGG